MVRSPERCVISASCSVCVRLPGEAQVKDGEGGSVQKRRRGGGGGGRILLLAEEHIWTECQSLWWCVRETNGAPVDK